MPLALSPSPPFPLPRTACPLSSLFLMFLCSIFSCRLIFICFFFLEEKWKRQPLPRLSEPGSAQYKGLVAGSIGWHFFYKPLVMGAGETSQGCSCP